MVCVVRQEVFQLVLVLCMFVVSVQGAAQTTISCGTSGGVVGQPQVLNCSILGSIVYDIAWYRYDKTDSQLIVQCAKTSADDVGSCVAPFALRSQYDVSTQPQPPRNPSFTIISVSAEDLEVSWLCVDSTTFPDRASIPASSTCSLKQEIITTPSSSPTTDNGEATTILPTTTTEETTTILPTSPTEGPSPDRNCSLEGGVAFICDFVVLVVVFLVIIFVINKDLCIQIKIVIIVVFAVVSGVLGGGSYAACIDGISIGGIGGINTGCVVLVSVITIVVVKFACKETKK